MALRSNTHTHNRLLARAAQEARLARREIREGRFQRSMAVMAAFAAIVSGFEAYAQHLRGAFRHWLMWTPVVLTPPVVLSAAAAFFSQKAARWLLPWVSLASLVDGVVGFVFHVRGIQKMPGGFKLGQYNIVMGPPIFAPLLVCIVGILGMLAAFLRRERPARVEGRLDGPTFTPGAWRVGRRRGVVQVESQIAHGRFQQGMALISAFLGILAGGEAYLEHLRGSYNQRVMWTPVWVTPPMVVAAVGAARSERVARNVLPLTSLVTFADGMLGFILHLRGIKRMPGGFSNLQFDVMMGPPLFAPLLFCAVGLIGFVAVLMRRGSGK